MKSLYDVMGFTMPQQKQTNPLYQMLLDGANGDGGMTTQPFVPQQEQPQQPMQEQAAPQAPQVQQQPQTVGNNSAFQNALARIANSGTMRLGSSISAASRKGKNIFDALSQASATEQQYQQQEADKQYAIADAQVKRQESLQKQQSAMQKQQAIEDYIASLPPEQQAQARTQALLDPKGLFNVGKPLTPLAKLDADFKAGRISVQDYQAIKQDMLTNGTGGSGGGVRVSVGAPTINVPSQYQPLTKPTLNSEQAKLIDKQAALVNFNTIKEKILNDPYVQQSFTTQGTLLANAGDLQKRLNIPTLKIQDDIRIARARVLPMIEQSFNAYRQAVTGASATDAEIARLRASFLDTKLPLDTFMARLDTFIQQENKGISQTQGNLRNGLNVGVNSSQAAPPPPPPANGGWSIEVVK